MTRLTAAALLAALALATPAGAEQVDPRREMEALERALDGAVRQVSRSSATHVLGVGEACRGYRLAGYGAVFVLSPRLLPVRRGAPHAALSGPALDAAIAALEDVLARVQVPDQRVVISRRLDVLRRQRVGRVTGAKPAGPSTEAALRESPQEQVRAMEEQARALDAEAAKAREEAERSIAEVEQEVRSRLSPAPPAPAPPPLAAVPPVDPLPPVPPWRLWFDGGEEPGARTADSLVADVRTAVTRALEAEGGGLKALGSEEFVVVAVDFFPRGSFGAWERPARTLVVRVRKKELEDRQAGRLLPEELRKRIEYTEY